MEPALPAIPDNWKLEDDYRQPYLAFQQAPTPQNSGKMLQAVQPVIDKALTSFSRGSAASPVLRSRAKAIALNSLQSYQPERGRLKNHLWSGLQELQRYATQQQQIISVPERVALQQQQLAAAENELRDRYGRDPSDAEIMDYMSIPAKRLAYIRQGARPTAESAATRIDSEGDMIDPTARPLAQNQNPWLDFVYGDLSPTDQFILDSMLGRNGRPKMSLTQIAHKLKITPGAVSQRTKKIQEMLDRQDELELLE